MNRFHYLFAPAMVAVMFALLALLVVVSALAASNTEPTNPSSAPASLSPPSEPQPERSVNSREQIIAERLELLRTSGEIQWIESESERFLAVFRDSYDALPQGAIIINTSPGTIVDGRPVHRTIAQVAAAAGWLALSLQPELAPSDSINEPAGQAKLRLNAAFNYLVTKSVENIVVIGDARGADDAVNYIIEKASPAISGFVGLGEWDTPLDGTNVSILDIVGTRDQGAIAQQRIRAEKYRRREKLIERFEINGAGPGFYGYEDQISKRIRGWLERVTPGIAMRQR